MLARRALPGRLARRGRRDAADLGDFQRGRSEIAAVALHAGDEFEHVTFRFAAEAVPDVALKVDFARGPALRVERAQHRALWPAAKQLQVITSNNLLER